MLTPDMWDGPGCGDKISEGMSTSGPYSSTSAPHCLQEEEQSKERTCTHLGNKPCIPTEESGASEEIVRPPLVFH